ncbi:HU family DNA-binding protein [Hallella multisaccharivorax]|nr:HU family DNA-binding protein [Hallella multisaccharivorax]
MEVIIEKSYSFINNTTMTKADLIKKIAEGAGITSAEAKKALNATTEAIKDALVKGEKLQLIGFGTFSVNERSAREGKNPRTGEVLHIAARKVAKFKAGTELDKQLNA